MQHLIKDGEVILDDPWQLFDIEDAQAMPGHAVLPVSIWSNNGAELLKSSLPFGAVVKEDENIDDLLPYLAKLEVIAFNFAKFADGRAFTYARSLRDLHKYTGDIRAVGDFMPDQVNYLQRCGFSSFAMRTSEEVGIALAIKDSISVKYQSDTREKAPLYRRR